MFKKIYVLLLMITICFIGQVYASNDVDYTLTITKDYDFNEVINYSLTNYKAIKNGNNYFNMIVGDDIYTDITYKTKYKKVSSKSNGTYKVKLSHNFSEYSLSNSRLLNDCFEKSSYDYDMDTISFSGTGGFNCLNGDSLSIKIITDFEVDSTNATVKGNTYTWVPTGNDFVMNIKLKKTYEETKSDDNLGHGIDEQSNADDSLDDYDGTDSYDSDNLAEEDFPQTESNSTISGIVIAIIFVILSIIGIIVAIILKNKKNQLNKI